MSHRIYYEHGVKNEWYVKSVAPIMKKLLRKNSASSPAIFKAYSEAYGVKLLFDRSGFLDYVEFENDDDAVMFMLRWS